MSEQMTQRFWDNTAKMIADDIGLLLLTLTHAQLASALTVVSAVQDVTSRGTVFRGWPMIPRLPSASTGAKRGGITIQNVDPRIGVAVRALKGRVGALFEYVSRDEPNELIWSHGGLFLQNIDVDDAKITAEVVGHASDNQAWPISVTSITMTPGLYVL